MMNNRFANTLKMPLPSKRNKSSFMTESADDIINESFDDLDDNDDEEKARLSEEEEQNVDERIKRVATPILLQDELGTVDEVDMFKESVEMDLSIDEGYFTERTIVRFDKKARRSQLKKVAVLAIAKEKNDPLYKKLVTIWKMERKLEQKLMEKYDAKANEKVKKYIANAKKSKSNVIKRAINKITGK